MTGYSALVSTAAAPKKSAVSVRRLICVNAVVCGLELCANAGFAYIPPILLKAGFSETVMSYIMGIGPVIALITVPGIGSWSDQTRCSWGRRRPFILFLNLIMLSSLVLIPLGHFRAVPGDPSRLAGVSDASAGHWSNSQAFRTVVLAVGVVLLDYASQACFNPCEALLTDVMKDDSNVERGFVVYSAMLSLGACLGTLTTAVDWTAFAVACGVDVSTLIFCLLFACSALCLVVTLAAAQEVPLRSKDRERERERAVDVARRWAVSGVCAVCRIPVMVGRALMHRARRGGVLGLALCLLAGLLTLLLEVVRWPFQFVKMYRSSPEALRRLFLADLASWTCLMGHGIFYTDFVAQAIYKGAPDADVGSEEASGYDEGARMGSWGLCFFSIVGFMYSTFAQEWIVGKVGLKWNYMGCLTTLVICMVGHIWFTSITVLNTLSALAGVGFAAVTSVPNTLITVYHSNLDLYDPHSKPSSRKSSDASRSVVVIVTDNNNVRQHETLDSKCGNDVDVDDDDDNEDERGVATDISLLDTAYFLSQIILSLTMGYLVDLTGSTTTYMAASAVAGILSIYLAAKVPFTTSQLRSLIKEA